jgi:hypothetical protein
MASANIAPPAISFQEFNHASYNLAVASYHDLYEAIECTKGIYSWLSTVKQARTAG